MLKDFYVMWQNSFDARNQSIDILNEYQKAFENKEITEEQYEKMISAQQPVIDIYNSFDYIKFVIEAPRRKEKIDKWSKQAYSKKELDRYEKIAKLYRNLKK